MSVGKVSQRLTLHQGPGERAKLGGEGGRSRPSTGEVCADRPPHHRHAAVQSLCPLRHPAPSAPGATRTTRRTIPLGNRPCPDGAAEVQVWGHGCARTPEEGDSCASRQKGAGGRPQRQLVLISSASPRSSS